MQTRMPQTMKSQIPMNIPARPHQGPTSGSYAADPRDASGGASAPRTDLISIPVPAREVPISSLALSVRLARLLEVAGVRRLGDLHGKTFSEFNDYHYNGPRTRQDLQELVRTVRLERPLPQAERFMVPAAARDFSPIDFPLSVRLDSALRAKRVSRFGDLDGMALKDLKELRNCGWLTIRELVRLLERIDQGEFALRGKPGSPTLFANLLSRLDTNLGALRERERKTILLRFGDTKGNRGWTLNQIGVRFHITRECVRQDLERTVPLVRKGGGPELSAQLSYIAATCQEKVCPLTPALLAQWLGGNPSSLRFSFPFYVRLLGELEPQIPAWPLGQEPARPWTKRVEPLASVLEEILAQHKGELPAKQAFELTILNSKTRKLSAAKFLNALVRSRNIAVEFPKPDAPHLRSRRRASGR